MTTQAAPAGALRPRYLAVAVTILAIVATFAIIARIGAGEAAREERVLAVLDPLMQWLQVSGKALRDWALANSSDVARSATGIAAAIALLGCVVGGRRGAPLLLLAAAVSLATWGQVLLLQDQIATGALLYAAGILCAVGLGIWCPEVRLAASGTPRSGFAGWEGVVVFLLAVTAMLTRLYALTELPVYYEIENVVSILATRTMAGMRQYVPVALTGNSNGLAHLFPQLASFTLLGTSIYSIRLVAACFGVAAVPLFYWLVRRLAGSGPALVGTALLIAAPEQLYWTRAETTPFAALVLFGLVTVHLGLWMAERLSVGSVLAAALWIPFGFFFYVPARVMIAYPLLIYAHALVFRGRAAWRTIWYAAPLLAGGLVLSYFSLSIIFLPFNNWQWRFVPPMPNPVLTGEGQVHETDLLGAVTGEVVAVSNNIGTVVQSMTYHTGFSEWYQRADDEKHPTVSNVAVVVVALLTLGYLLGQIYEPRSFALLLWIGLGLLPGVMSANPAPRRIGLIFPGLYAVCAVGIGAAVRLIRARAGRVLAAVTSAVLAVAIAGVLLTSMITYLLIRSGVPWVARASRSAASLFDKSNVIYHNLDGNVFALLVFLNADNFLQNTPGIRYVNPAEWLAVALREPCDFTDLNFRYVMSPAEIEALRQTYKPARMSVLLMDQPQNQPYMDLMRALFPSADVPSRPVGQEVGSFWVLTAENAAVEALRSPVLRAGNDATELATKLLAGVRLRPQAWEDSRPDAIEVEAGLLVERDGWYRAATDPPCDAAALTIDGRPIMPTEVRPLPAGIHSLRINLPNASACTLPMQLRLVAADERQPLPDNAPILSSPALTAVPQAVAPPLTVDAGYASVEPLPKVDGALLDFGIDGQGAMTLLFQDKQGAVRMRRVDSQGKEEAAWQVTLPPGAGLPELSVAPDGISFVVVAETVMLYDQRGKPLGGWKDPPVLASSIGHLPDGRVLLPFPGEHGLALVSRDGTVLNRWRTFEGGLGVFFEPAAVVANSQGDIVVIQTDGRALVFHNSGDEFNPVFVREFHINFSGRGVHPRGVSFVGTDRLAVSDPDNGATLIYGLDGTRIMAADPERDLTNKQLGVVRRFQLAGERLYLLDDARTLRVASR